MSNVPNGRDILKTLIELLEAQEQIKVKYAFKEIGTKDIKDTKDKQDTER